jgi:protein-S-isoprenylcysteine O-methyltransferase Ste14
MLAAAWSGATLFLASLLYFAYFYLVRLGQPAPVSAASVATAVAVNALLFSSFALHHSVFARTGVKARLARLLPQGLERSAYVWLASLLFLAVCLLWQPVPGIAWQATGVLRWLLHAVQLGGLALTLQSAARIDIWELAGVRQARIAGSRSAPPEAASPAPATAADSQLSISGPYRWLRHPIYLGWVMLVFGVPTMTMGRLLFASISTLYLIVAIPFEERSLTQEFGASYTDYQERVRWRLVPGVW